jgi:peptidoglycan hydrolase-like protein with peptidoglycan-binding domain
LPSLSHLRARVTVVGVVIAAILVAGIWIAMNHASAQPSASGKSDPRHTTRKAPPATLRVISVTPAGHAKGVDGTAPIKIRFSSAVAKGSPMPAVRPDVPGSWQGAGSRTLEFVPDTGFGQYAGVTVSIPGGASGVRASGGGVLASSLTVKYKVRGYAATRLDELLAQLGYLPLNWTAAPGADVPASSDAAGQLAAAYKPPQGQFTWQSGWPSELHQFWDNGSPSGLMVHGAVMLFENNHGLTMDGIAGRQVWRALLKAVAAGQDNTLGYTYALASEGNPETLTVWHDGKQIMHSLANTGIQAAPTTIGTAPVYLRYYYQIMKGTNPDGSKYADPVYYVSYFRAGEAVHYFPRGSYGFPQSLGCVELPWSSAKFVWPYMNYGTLVTVAPGALTPSGSPGAN